MNSPNYISPHFQKVHYPSSRNRDFRAAEGLNGGQVGEPVELVNVTKTEYMYKFQNPELQDELGLNWYSFKWRNYMPDIGRFFNVDPLSEQYSYQSHYNFSENRVVDGIELEGLEYVSVHHYANGAVAKTEYYKMSNSQIKSLGGAPAGIHNSVPYGA